MPIVGKTVQSEVDAVIEFQILSTGLRWNKFDSLRINSSLTKLVDRPLSVAAERGQKQ